MANTSILGTRTWKSERDTSSTSVIDDHHENHVQQSAQSGSEALLQFLHIASKACVGVATDLEPVNHLETLGEGLSFSVKGHIRNQSGSYVLKVFKHSLVAGRRSDFDRSRFRALMMEAHILGHRPLHDHENIVTMQEIALAVNSSNPLQISPALVLERAPHGTLASFQQSTTRSKVDWLKRKMLSYDVAAGIEALHDSGVVHGDLKAENVLIFDHPTRGYVAKISDFGSAVILPITEPALDAPKIRLPAYTPPWNAPEAMTFVSPEVLPKSDAYSLGLLIWRILVHRDPFLLFDIPLEPETRLHAKKTILSLPNIAGLIPCFIEDEVGFLDADEVLLLTLIFANTINPDPNLRYLSRVLSLLKPYSGRTSAQPALNSLPEGSNTHIPRLQQDSSRPVWIQPFTDELTKIAPHLDWFQRFHHMVQSQILLALEDICGFVPVRNGQHPNVEGLKNPRLREDAIWAVFRCHLLGIGTKPDPKTALDVLYFAGLPEFGSYWKSWVLLGQLHKALQIKMTDDRMVKVLAMDVRATLVSDFSRIVLSDREPREDMFIASHRLDTTREQIEELKVRIGLPHTNDYSRSMLVVSQFEITGGNNLLHVSAFYDDVTLAEYLLKHSTLDMNATNVLGETALLIASRYNSYEVLDLLLRYGADASIKDRRAVNALFWLTSIPEHSRADIAQRLLTNGAKLMCFLDSEEMENIDLIPDTFFDHGRVEGGPLMQAIARRDLSSVKILLQLCVKQDMPPVGLAKYLFPLPLRLAAELHLYEILEYLCFELRKVFTMIIPEVEKDNGLIGEVFTTSMKSSAVLRGAIRTKYQIHRLCYHGKSWKIAADKTMKVLHTFGFVFTHLASHGSIERTLNFAIASGTYEIVDELLSHKHFLDTIDEADESHYVTPVHQALKSRKLDVLKLLIEKGATVDLRTKRDPKHQLSGAKASYLHVVASLRIEDNAFAEVLLDNGIPPGAKDKRGFDVFSLAMARCSFNLARLLLDRGYSLHTTGMFGLNVLGDRLYDRMLQQHDNIYEAVKFLLSYERPGTQSQFIVDTINQQSVLHIAAAFPWPDEIQYKNMLTLLLSCFGKPEQLNFQTTTQSKSTPLQIAIASRNSVAVAALIEAGCDLETQDMAGADAMALARSTIVKFISMDAASKPMDSQKELGRTFQTLNILASRKTWPEDFRLNQQIIEGLASAKPLLEQMTRMSHSECYLLGYERKALDLVFGHVTQQPATLDAGEDMRRQINSILEPCLYAELVTYVSPSTEWATRQRDSYTAVRQRIPWTKTVVDAWLSTFQQAAAFEWILDEIRQRIQGSADHENWYGLSRYAISGDPAHLPIDHKFVRWPPTLLDWYVRAVQEDKLDLEDEEKDEVTYYVSILRSRAMAQARGQFPLPPFPTDFKKLHFEDLQPGKLVFDEVCIATMAYYRCRCAREKISNWTITHVEQHTDAVDLYLDLWGSDPIGSLRVAKEREVERDGRYLQWKNDIGILEGEGQIERTGLRRRLSQPQGMENVSLEMLQMLMQSLGLTPEEVGLDAGQGYVEETFDDIIDEDQRHSDAANEENSNKIGTTNDARHNHGAHSSADEKEAGEAIPAPETDNTVEIPSATVKNTFQTHFQSRTQNKTPQSRMSLTSQLASSKEIQEPHIKAALCAYLFHAYVKDLAARFNRDQKYMITHIRDYKSEFGFSDDNDVGFDDSMVRDRPVRAMSF